MKACMTVVRGYFEEKENNIKLDFTTTKCVVSRTAKYTHVRVQ